MTVFVAVLYRAALIRPYFPGTASSVRNRWIQPDSSALINPNSELYATIRVAGAQKGVWFLILRAKKAGALNTDSVDQSPSGFGSESYAARR